MAYRPWCSFWRVPDARQWAVDDRCVTLATVLLHAHWSCYACTLGIGQLQDLFLILLAADRHQRVTVQHITLVAGTWFVSTSVCVEHSYVSHEQLPSVKAWRQLDKLSFRTQRQECEAHRLQFWFVAKCRLTNPRETSEGQVRDPMKPVALDQCRTTMKQRIAMKLCLRQATIFLSSHHKTLHQLTAP
jgi:hypothetical protein